MISGWTHWYGHFLDSRCSLVSSSAMLQLQPARHSSEIVKWRMFWTQLRATRFHCKTQRFPDPYIFWNLVTPTIDWPIAHSPITHPNRSTIPTKPTLPDHFSNGNLWWSVAVCDVLDATWIWQFWCHFGCGTIGTKQRCASVLDVWRNSSRSQMFPSIEGSNRGPDLEIKLYYRDWVSSNDCCPLDWHRFGSN